MVPLGGVAATAARYGDEAVALLNAACSFSAETVVHTPEGEVPIAAVSVGDEVLAFHEATGTTGTFPIIAVWSHLDPVVVTLTIEHEQIETTPEHPFFVAGAGWTPADDLEVGNPIQQRDGTTGVVQAITTTARPQVMYNFTVAIAHTYFVGDEGWLVHNACQPYEVGPFNVLKNKSDPNDGLEIHHLPQSAPASQVIATYDHNTAPAMALPTREHRALPKLRGTYRGTSQDLIRRNIDDLRRYTRAPEHAIQQIISLIDRKFPGAR